MSLYLPGCIFILMIKHCHKLQAPACIKIGAFQSRKKIKPLGIPESHDIEAPFIELPGPVNEIIQVTVRQVIEHDPVQAVENIERVGL